MWWCDMSGYILSILGIVIVGVLVDIVVPSGTINKYIKSIYAIFVLAVILSPVIKFLSNTHDINVNITGYKINEDLMNYINTNKIKSLETNIENKLKDEGFDGIDIKINYSIESNELMINSCTVNMQNLVITSDKQHINKYEFIIEVVREYTNLADEEIIFYE